MSVGGCLGGEVEGWWLVNDKVLHNIMREMTRRGEMDYTNLERRLMLTIHVFLFPLVVSVKH